MRIGILGGTFNPVHIGHLILAEYARQALRLDKLFFVPANISPLKSRSQAVSSYHRLEMLKLAIRGCRDFAISDMEIKRGGKSYTLETLYAFLKEFNNKKDKIFFISGSDSLGQLNRWKDFKQILKIAKFVVAERPGFSPCRPSGHIKTIQIPQIDISSSLIRARLRAGKSVQYLVPDRVAAYIKKGRLFR
ncbi:MAG: nicotinate-nucleotide adenylyltransferase [Candidatus Omnitrophica bacterium]|nr:nicotinate-nucleotide adenylyltransferase [Candidatus Omnitrophota bacterium]